MRLLRISDYQNVLDKIDMSYKDIIESIEQQRLTFINVKNDVVE